LISDLLIQCIPLNVSFRCSRHTEGKKETRASTGMRDLDFRNEEFVILLRSSHEPSCASHAPTIITNYMGYGGAMSDTASLMECISVQAVI